MKFVYFLIGLMTLMPVSAFADGVSFYDQLNENPVKQRSVDCSCVAYLHDVLGVNIHGNAWTILPNVETRFVREGDVILLDYNLAHAALVTSVFEPEKGNLVVTISESNFHRCKPSTRVLSLSDPHIRGIYRPLWG